MLRAGRILFLVATILVWFASQTKASHAVGADLAYSCLGNNQYRIDFTFYRDCAGISYPSSATLNLYSASCGRSFSVSLPRQGPPVILQTVCATQQTTCTGGSFPGIQQVKYSGVVTLPAQCSDWLVSYTLCCRNNAITNLNNPGSQNIYVEALINNTNGLCNNSPIFSTPPVPFVCIGQQTYYNHGGVDFDGDQLTFNLINPLTARNSNIPYKGSYSVTNPMSTTGGFSFNTSTGQMAFTPAGRQNAVVTVRVTETRNGQVIGYTMRDIQIVAVNCGNNDAPTMSGIDGSGPGFNGGTAIFTTNLCAGNNVCFDVLFDDQNNGDVLTVTHSPLPTGATFTVSGGQPPTGTFCWNPSISDTGSHNFFLTVKDDACPITGQQVQAFTVNVLPPAFSLSTSSTPNTCPGGSDGSATVHVSPGAVPPVTYQWSNGGTGQTINNVPAGNYTVTVSDAVNCAQVTVAPVIEPPAFNVNYSVIPAQCNGAGNGAATAFATGGTAPGGSYSYSWSTGSQTNTITNVPSGNYVVTVTDQVGCVFVDSVFIFQPGPLVINLAATSVADYNGADISCNGANDGIVAAFATGGTLPYTFDWSANAAGQTNDTIYNLGPGTYLVTVTDSNGCNTGTSITITEPDVVVSNAVVTSNYHGQDISCFGADDGTARVFASGGTFPYSYDWGPLSGSQTASTATSLGPGTYVVTVSDVNGCTDTSSVILEEPPPVTTNALPGSSANGFNISCNGLNDGIVQVFASGGTPGYRFRWDDPYFQITNIVSDLYAGQYYVTVTDVNGCSVLDSVTLVEPPPLVSSISVTSDYAGQDVSCFGSSDGEATVVLAGGVPPYRYSWDDPAMQQTPVATGLSANVLYTVALVDTNECTDTVQIMLTEPDSISLSTQVVSNYNGADISCTGASDGELEVLYSGGTPGYTVLWDANANNQNTDIATGLVAGSYMVTVTDTNGCMNSTTGTLADPPLLNSSAAVTSNYNGQDISCNGAADASIAANAAGGTGSYAYSWDASAGSATSSGVNNLGPGNYAVTVTDDNGCTTTSTVNVTEPAALVLNTTATTNFNGYNISCYGFDDGEAVVTVTGGTPQYFFNWDDRQNQQDSIADNLEAGLYGITVTDVNGCSNTDTVSLNEPTALNAIAAITSNYNGQDISCFNAMDGEATGSATGGVTPYGYLWDPGSQNTPVATGLDANVLYAITITDDNGCVDTAQVLLSQPTQITANSTVYTDYNGQDISCFGASDGGASVLANGGTAPLTFLWDAGAHNSTGATAPNLAAGTYQVTVTDVNGCQTIDTIVLTEPSQVTAVASVFTPISCNGLTDGELTVLGGGGVPTYNYQWSFNAGTQTTQTASGLGAGTYDVSVTDQNGCRATDQIVLGEPPAIVIDLAPENVRCFGEDNGQVTANVSGGTGGYAYVWNTTPQQTGMIATGLSPNNYMVTVTDDNGCTETADADVFEPPVLLTSTTGVDPTCYGGTDGEATTFPTGGVGNYSYNWSDPAAQTTQTATSLGSGLFSVTVSDSNGCMVLDTIRLNDPAQIIVRIDTDSVTLPFGGEIQLNSSYVTSADNLVTYEWSSLEGLDCYSCPNPVAGPLTTTTYVLRFTDADGCVATDEVLIVIDPRDRRLFLPNAFTPNGDGVNDVFFPMGLGITTINMKIFDRWGEKLYETNDISKGWDGYYNGVLLMPGVYVYILTATFEDGFEEFRKGSVTLLR